MFCEEWSNCGPCLSCDYPLGALTSGMAGGRCKKALGIVGFISFSICHQVVNVIAAMALSFLNRWYGTPVALFDHLSQKPTNGCPLASCVCCASSLRPLAWIYSWTYSLMVLMATSLQGFLSMETFHLQLRGVKILIVIDALILIVPSQRQQTEDAGEDYAERC